jgi:hypothetical protein
MPQSSFTDLIEQMKTEKQSREAEPSFDDLINQMKTEKHSQASPPAPEHESGPDLTVEPNSTSAGRAEAQPKAETDKQSTEEALMQQLVQHLEEARASRVISEDLYNAMKPPAPINEPKRTNQADP